MEDLRKKLDRHIAEHTPLVGPDREVDILGEKDSHAVYFLSSRVSDEPT